MMTLLVVSLGLLILAASGVLVYLLFLHPEGDRELATVKNNLQNQSRYVGSEASSTQVNVLKNELKRKAKEGKRVALEDKFFFAGMFSNEERTRFHTSRTFAPIIGGVLAGILSLLGTGDILLGVLAGIVFALGGMQLPFTMLDRTIKRRQEEIMYFLPLVIEQIAIGVSSSLDIGPCISRVIDMADERDTHNPVTELLRFAQNYVKSGASLEEAMTEIGIKSGHNEVKHAFMSLAQVAKHGGNVIKQLQDLADAVAMQREAKIEEVIKKLELHATGPVGFVFLGFLILLLTVIMLHVYKAF